jgi:uncharacterized glyoxalase superfamily protein PhnB
MTGQRAMSEPIRPMLHARSLDATIAFYVDSLGFTLDGTWPSDDPTWCSLRSGAARIMFTSDPSEGPLEPMVTGSIYFYPADVDAFFDALPATVASLHGPQDTPWGMREFSLEDPNGYLLKFGQPATPP